jgi:acetylglutamate kinase
LWWTESNCRTEESVRQSRSLPAIEDLLSLLERLFFLIGENGETYNINADTAAGAIAGALNANRLLMLTDVPGVLDTAKALLPDLSVSQIHALIANNTISGGMIPKVLTCIEAVKQGVKGATILDGRVPHALLLELFTEGGIGTLIHK